MYTEICKTDFDIIGWVFCYRLECILLFGILAELDFTTHGTLYAFQTARKVPYYVATNHRVVGRSRRVVSGILVYWNSGMYTKNQNFSIHFTLNFSIHFSIQIWCGSIGTLRIPDCPEGPVCHRTPSRHRKITQWCCCTKILVCILKSDSAPECILKIRHGKQVGCDSIGTLHIPDCSGGPVCLHRKITQGCLWDICNV